MKHIIGNRPEKEPFGLTVESALIGKLGRREYGKLRDRMMAATRRPRRRRKGGAS